MKKITIIFLCYLLAMSACSDSNNDPGKEVKPEPTTPQEFAERNLIRAMEITDQAMADYFLGEGMTMARFYNPYTGNRSGEIGSVWMYTSSIEATNAILNGLETLKANGNAELYDKNFDRYVELQKKLYENADYYKGTFTLTSFTQTKEWTVYGVNRGSDKGSAVVEGKMNVYDDQMWLIRELIESYKLTNNLDYLTEAEYLTEYVLDGWDCTLDASNKEHGGIFWGPGYVTKHSCSNGPMVSPLVWLHELYKGKNDEITHRYIDPDKSRKTKQVKKSDYYLDFAKKIYDWQKEALLTDDGVYDDMMGGCGDYCDVAYETINNVTYRKHANLADRVGPPITYNSGAMLSGAADLYRATSKSMYTEDATKLSDASHSYFAKAGATIEGHDTYDLSGFRNWFNGVLMRGYVDVYPTYKNTNKSISGFQKNLDYGYSNFLYKGLLPANLLVGWSYPNGDSKIEAMFTFAFVAEYAVLAKYELEKDN